MDDEETDEDMAEYEQMAQSISLTTHTQSETNTSVNHEDILEDEHEDEYTVDEHGTKWYEDGEGVWWYWDDENESWFQYD